MGKKFKIILFAIIVSCILSACGDISTDSSSTEHNTVSKKSKNDEIISVVDSYWKAVLNQDTKEVTSYCADSLKDKVRKEMVRFRKEIKKEKSVLMDEVVNSAQGIFVNIDDTDDLDVYDMYDILDVEDLRKDKDMKKAIDELCEGVLTNGIVYYFPEKPKMISDKKAKVKVEFYVKDISKDNESLLDNVKGYLSDAVLDKIHEKLLDNPNFLKRHILKKVIKEELIYGLRSAKEEYEKCTDKIPKSTKVYHLKKKKGSWFITKINAKNVDDSDDDYFEDYFEMFE